MAYPKINASARIIEIENAPMPNIDRALISIHSIFTIQIIKSNTEIPYDYLQVLLTDGTKFSVCALPEYDLNPGIIPIEYFNTIATTTSTQMYLDMKGLLI